MIEEDLKNIAKKNHAKALIMSGTYGSDLFVEGWSDIDLLFVLDDLHFSSIKTITKDCKNIQKDKTIKIGTSFLTKEEYLSQNCELIYYKANLMRYNIRFGISKILYSEIKHPKVELPKYKKYLLRETNYFQARIRNAIRDFDDLDCFKEAIKCIQHTMQILFFLEFPGRNMREDFRLFDITILKEAKLPENLYEYIRDLKKNYKDITNYHEETIKIFNYAEKLFAFIKKHYYV